MKEKGKRGLLQKVTQTQFFEGEKCIWQILLRPGIRKKLHPAGFSETYFVGLMGVCESEKGDPYRSHIHIPYFLLGTPPGVRYVSSHLQSFLRVQTRSSRNFSLSFHDSSPKSLYYFP